MFLMKGFWLQVVGQCLYISLEQKSSPLLAITEQEAHEKQLFSLVKFLPPLQLPSLSTSFTNFLILAKSSNSNFLYLC
jgi:hypothetical protein